MNRDINFEKLHQHAHCGRHDGAAPRQPHQPRNIGLKVDREVPAVKFAPHLVAVIAESLDGRLDQPHAAVIPVEADIPQKIIQRSKFGQIAVRRQNLQMRAFPEADSRLEISNDKRDRLPEIPIGRVPHQSGASEGVRGMNHGIY